MDQFDDAQTEHWQKPTFNLGVGCGTEENLTIRLH